MKHIKDKQVLIHLLNGYAYALSKKQNEFTPTKKQFKQFLKHLKKNFL